MISVSCVHQHLGAELPLLDMGERIISGLQLTLEGVFPSLSQLKFFQCLFCPVKKDRPFLDKTTVARNLPFC